MPCVKSAFLRKKRHNYRTEKQVINMNTLKTQSPPMKGLSDEEVKRSRAEHGENVLSTTKKRSFFKQFAMNMGDPVIRILLCALVLNILFLFRNSDIYETVGIGISVFLATFISTISEYGSEAAFEKLRAESEKSVYRVRRDGKVREIKSEEIVVGDVILLAAGERIPCDCVIVSGNAAVDQSPMTGESKEVNKFPNPDAFRRESKEVNKIPISDTVRGNYSLDPSQSHALLGGCTIVSGECEAVAASVGDKTFLGGISLEVQMPTRESPLKIRLTALAKTISRIGYVSAALVAVAYLINSFVIDSGFHPALITMKLSNVKYLFEELLHAFTLGLTVIVVAVPEGLPMMIAVVLSANIKRMIKDNVLVRKPVGIEAAGSMNILFTDKTGTLTEGKLSVCEYLLGDGTSVSPSQKKGPPIYDLLTLSGLYNTSSKIGEDEKGNISAVGGNMTDMAITESVIGVRRLPKVSVADKIPFDSEKKYSAVRLAGEVNTVFIKGAPERLLPFTKFCRKADGSTAPLNTVRLERLISEETARGKRAVLIAESGRMPSTGLAGASLTLIGVAILSDRVRREAKNAVKSLRGAGIHVVMVTGDNIETARHIAAECGIIDGEVDLCITASELARLGDMRLRELLPRIGVIARALPSDKSRLVRVSQEAELVVGMTGDGINDAPALRRADIGFAMGGGTQVAKEAGDIIILDGNLASIARAVLYGRNIFKSIRKFIALQLTMNFSAVAVSMIGPFIGYDAPVTVVQMLWINIIMDTLGGLAFAGEAALPSCMKEKPKRRDEPILCGYMVSEIVWLGSFTTALSIYFLKSPSVISSFRYDENNIYLLTAFFALFIFASVFNCFNARTDSLNLFRGLPRNRAFLGIMFSVCVLQIGFVYLGGSVLRTAPLTLEELRFTLLLALSVFPADLARKAFLRIIGKKSGY